MQAEKLHEQMTTTDKPLPLWAHQREALQRAEQASGRYAFHFDPGCGKSRPVLELFNRSKFNNALIFAPLNVCRNWENEISKFCKTKNVYIVAGQTKAKKLKIINEARCDTNARILIANIESLRSDEYIDALLPCEFQFIIADEFHNFKSPKSLQTKGLFRLLVASTPAHFYTLTGTPAPQGEIDLWTTFYTLGITELPFFVWRKKYFDDKNAYRKGQRGYFPNFTVRASRKDIFQKQLSSCSSYANKNEVLDLPELLHTNIYCELAKPQRGHYESMYDLLFARDEDGNELSASTILARTVRLQQIVAGFLGNTPIESNRLSALDAAIELTGAPTGSKGPQFIIWTIFAATYWQIAAHLKSLDISFGMLTGEIDASTRHQTIQDFQAGNIRALIAHPKAGGVGVNLTAASFSIHYLKDFNLVNDLQCEARNYRAGSEIHKRITRIDIIAQDTIDEQISTALRAKKSVQDFILGIKNGK